MFVTRFAFGAIFACVIGIAFGQSEKGGSIELISRALPNPNLTSGTSAPSMSSDGTTIAFATSSLEVMPVVPSSTSIQRIYVVNVVTGQRWHATNTVSGNSPNGSSGAPHLSADGRYVVFYSSATNLLSDFDTQFEDVFRFDCLTGTLTRVSKSDNEAPTNGSSGCPSISEDGSKVVFYSIATNIKGGQGHSEGRVFCSDLATSTTTLVSKSLGEVPGEGLFPIISDSGRFVLFMSRSIFGTTLNNASSYNCWRKDLSNGLLERYITTAWDGGSIFSTFGGSMSPDDSAVFMGAGRVFDPAIVGENRLLWGLWEGAWGIVDFDAALGIPNYESGNGRISNSPYRIAFESKASNLIPDDTNGKRDIFVRDTALNQIQLVSKSSSGLAGNGDSGNSNVTSVLSHLGGCRISSSGRFVLFNSNATNLVTNDTNGVTDIFLRDLSLQTTERVSTRYTAMTMPGNGNSFSVSVSADGNTVAFDSLASNLVAGDTNDFDVFLWKRGQMELIKLTYGIGGVPGGGFGPSVSGNGRYVAFYSSATNMVLGDINGQPDIFVQDLENGTIELVSTSSDGTQGNGTSSSPSISYDGRFVCFYSTSSNLSPSDLNGTTDVFLKDRITGTCTLISRSVTGQSGNATSQVTSTAPQISGDGKFVVFRSTASDLVTNDQNGTSDVFRANRITSEIELVSLSSSGVQGNGASADAFVSFDGRYVAFSTSSANIVTPDTNSKKDLFVRDMVLGLVRKISWTDRGKQVNADCTVAGISSDGKKVVFTSRSTNILYGEDNQDDLFAFDGRRIQKISKQQVPTPVTSRNFTGVCLNENGNVIAFVTPAADLAWYDYPSSGLGNVNDVYVWTSP